MEAAGDGNWGDCWILGGVGGMREKQFENTQMLTLLCKRRTF